MTRYVVCTLDTVSEAYTGWLVVQLLPHGMAPPMARLPWHGPHGMAPMAWPSWHGPHGKTLQHCQTADGVPTCVWGCWCAYLCVGLLGVTARHPSFHCRGEGAHTHMHTHLSATQLSATQPNQVS